jgi:excisionase family DNA binding protein
MTLDVFDARLVKIETMLSEIQDHLAKPTKQREWYTVEEVAALLKKSTYTVREWCREGRINARKRSEKRGGTELWNISAAEVDRIRDEGFLTPDPHRNAGR